MRLSATRLSAIAHPGNRLPFNKFISALLSKSGRVAAYYGESWDEILSYNAAQVAAGTPANCVAFEESAGTIPLLAPLGSGKGCGLLKDRSGGNHHRIQTSATARGEMSRRVNLLGKTDQSDWSAEKAGMGTEPVRLGFVPAPDGSVTAVRWTLSIGGGVSVSDVSQIGVPSTIVSAVSWRVRVALKTFDGSAKTVSITNAATAVFNITLTGAWQIFTFDSVGLGILSQPLRIRLRGNEFTASSADICVAYPDLRLSADANIGKPFQRVTSASDYDEEGFPARWKLKTDDWAKSSISPVGANRAFVLTALRVNSSASLGVLAEYGPTAASTDGTFSLESLSSQITLRVRGASAGTTVSASVADSSYVVICALIDLASPRQELFINGVSAGVSTAAIGSTTFVARDLFVAARNGASSFANADSTAPLMAVFVQPGDPGLTSAEISRLTAQFKKSIAGY